jgi:hypothetical protein
MSRLVQNVKGILLGVLFFLLALSIADHTESDLADKRFDSHVVSSKAYAANP